MRSLTTILEQYDPSPDSIVAAAMFAAGNDHLAALDLLLSHDGLRERGVWLGVAGIKLLETACRCASPSVVARILREGVPIDGALDDDVTALMAAAARGATRIVDLLLDAGANIDACDTSGRTALIFACEGDVEDAVLVLVRRGAGVAARTRGYSALDVACAAGRARAVAALMDLPEVRACANLPASNGWTPLVAAAVRNSTATVDALLAHDEVLVDEVVDAGWTALGFAAQEGHVEVAERLLRRGAQVDIPRKSKVSSDEEGATPLLSAAANGHIEMIKLLLAQGANVNYSTPGYSVSALNLAVRNGHQEVVELLLKAGADVNNRGRAPFLTPLYTACMANRPGIAAILLAHGARVGMENENVTEAFSAYHHRWPWSLLDRLVEQTPKAVGFEMLLVYLRQKADREAAERVLWTLRKRGYDFGAIRLGEHEIAADPFFAEIIVAL